MERLGGTLAFGYCGYITGKLGSAQAVQSEQGGTVKLFPSDIFPKHSLGGFESVFLQGFDRIIVNKSGLNLRRVSGSAGRLP
ncbi:MAG: hypothetical protein R2822_08625 [Spirosomataceae bacterium]